MRGTRLIYQLSHKRKILTVQVEDPFPEDQDRLLQEEQSTRKSRERMCFTNGEIYTD
jgi:hypothetical protein